MSSRPANGRDFAVMDENDGVLDGHSLRSGINLAADERQIARGIGGRERAATANRTSSSTTTKATSQANIPELRRCGCMAITTEAECDWFANLRLAKPDHVSSTPSAAA